MSNNYLLDFSKFVNENYIRYEVEQALQEIVETVEILDYNGQLGQCKLELDKAVLERTQLAAEVATLRREKEALLEARQTTKSNALRVRNVFVSDIGSVLNEGRSVVKLKSKIRALEDRLAGVAELEAELEDTQQKLKSIEKAYYLTQSVRDAGGQQRVCLTTIEDQLLLSVFSFLQTEDVLSAAQVNRLLFARVDNLFSIGSELIQPEWLEGTDYSREIDDEDASPTGSGLLSQPLVDSLTQKLTAAEFQVILSMKEHLKKQDETIRKLTTQAEDLAAKVESTENVRDFLIEKLKTAEVAIKNFMKDNNELKVQAAADKEVLSYLDLRRLEIDSLNRDLLSKNEALRANVDVLTSLNAQTEKQYGMEVSELKDRLAMAEKEHKSQKKMLAKEVKMLRGLLVSNNEELERHRSHLCHLRKSLDFIGLGESSLVAHHPTAKSSPVHQETRTSTNPFA